MSSTSASSQACTMASPPPLTSTRPWSVNSNAATACAARLTSPLTMQKRSQKIWLGAARRMLKTA